MLGNWIIQTTTTTGSGNLTVSAVSGYPAFSSQFAVGELFSYVILDDATGLPVERGIGKRDASGVLVRSKILATMTAGSYAGVEPAPASLLAGTKRIICTPGAGSNITAAHSVWKGANVSGGLKGYGDVHCGGSVSVSTPIAAGKAYAFPFIAAVDCDLVGLAYRINATAADGFARTAIYSVNEDGLPGVKLAESAPESLATAGNKSGAFARMRPPPRFFGCILFDSAITMSGSTGQISNSHAMGYVSTMLPIAGVMADVVGTNFPSDWGALTLTRLDSSFTRPILVASCP